jgi:hypothetical protein
VLAENHRDEFFVHGFPDSPAFLELSKLEKQPGFLLEAEDWQGFFPASEADGEYLCSFGLLILEQPESGSEVRRSHRPATHHFYSPLSETVT